MVNILSVLSLLFAFTASAAIVPSGVPQATLGSAGSVAGSTVISPSAFSGSGVNGIFAIYAGDTNAAATSSNVYPFYKNGTLYQAGANGAYCWNMVASNGTATQQFQLMHDTVTFAFNATAASLTAPKYQSGAAGKYILLTGSAGVPGPISSPYKFAANSWPGFQAGANSNYVVSMLCYEP